MIPDPPPLNRVERALLALNKRHGVKAFMLLVTGASILVSLLATASLMLLTGANRADTIVGLAIAFAVPGMVAPLASGTLARLLLSLDHASTVMHHLSRTDSLTGVRNRRAFRDDATQLLGAQHEFFAVVAMVDVDEFKDVNDRHGHAVGDEVLQRLATNLVGAIDGAVVGRLGGDEFAIAAAAPTEESAAAIIQRLRHACDLTDIVAGLRASVGATIARAPIDLDVALAEADSRLYATKQRTGPHPVP